MISSSNDSGGLANQMFQYAAGYAHARKMGTSFYYPIKPQSPCNRSPNLYDIFPLSSSKTGEHGPVYSDRALGFHYNPIPETPDLTLHGYYQSEKYFKEYAEDIRKEFTFKNPSNTKVERKTVSIHVRRSDYLNHPNHHPLCTMEYYNKAMNEFRGYNFLIFSDDKEWCLEWFDTPNTQVSLAETAAEDLQLMSLCEHHIIANSSFSWWGSWLNPNRNKRVIAPKTWFGPAYNSLDTSDLYLPEWILL